MSIIKVFRGCLISHDLFRTTIGEEVHICPMNFLKGDSLLNVPIFIQTEYWGELLVGINFVLDGEVEIVGD